jgi:hypothetical protein
MTFHSKQDKGAPDTPTLEAEAMLAQAKFEARRKMRGESNKWSWKKIAAIATVIGAIGVGTIWAGIGTLVDMTRAPQGVRENAAANARNSQRIDALEQEQKEILKSLYRMEGKLGTLPPRQKDQLMTPPN